MKKTALWLLLATIIIGVGAYLAVTKLCPDRGQSTGQAHEPTTAKTPAHREAASTEEATAERRPPGSADAGGAPAEPAAADAKALRLVAGTILDADKKPVAAAEIILLAGPCTDETACTTTTDQAGKFRFDNVQAAAVELVLKRPPNGTPWCLGKVELPSKTPKELANLEFTLEKACTWTIEAKSDKDKLLAGVALAVTSRNSEELDCGDCPKALGCSMKTDEEGLATFANLQPGGYSLIARLEGYGTAIQGFGCDAEEAQEEPMVIALSAGGSIVGKVLDPDNRPAKDATVTCCVAERYHVRRNAPLATATCDAEGRFRITDLSEGRYFLVASADAFADGYLPEVRVTPGRQRPECTVLLVRAMPLEGRVVDTAQRPVEGATVKLERTFRGAPPRSFRGGRGFGPPFGWGDTDGDTDVAQVTTGPDGKFRFDKAPVKGARVVASKEGYRNQYGEAISGDQPMTIVLVPGPVITGTVTAAETGKPVEEATVCCLSDREEAETDAQGRYKLTSVSPGRQTFIAYAPGLASPALFKATVLNSGTTELDFALEPNAQITGVVTDARTGEPIVGAHLSALVEKKRRRPPRGRWYDDYYENMFRYAGPFQAYTDEQGHFSIPVSLPELTVVVAEANDYLEQRVELEGRDLTQPLRIQLKQGVVIAGQVLAPDGKPVAEAQVMCQAFREEEDEDEWEGGFVGFPGDTEIEGRDCDENGCFRIGGLSPGSYLLTATHKDFAPGERGPVELSADQVLDDVEIVLSQGGRIAGLVTDETGAPIEEATVSFAIEVEEEEEAPGSSPKSVVHGYIRSPASANATTDIDGRYTSGALPPGAYNVSASAPPRICRHPQRVVVEPGMTMTEINFTLEPGVEVSGKVLDEQGNPIAEANVTLRRLGNWDEGVTDETGTFVVGGLSSGEAQLRVSADGYLRHRQACTAPAHGLEIKLELGGTIVGRVVDKLTQKPIEVFYAAADGHREPPPMEYHAEGRFEFKGLSSGDHSVTVIADGYAVANVEDIKVEKGRQSPELLVQLAEGTTLTFTVTSALDGQPVPDVQVFSDEAPRARAVTDADGTCTIEHLAAGRYEFTLDHEAFATKKLRVKLGDDETRKEVAVALDKGLTVRGRVVSKADQRPVEGATVTLSETGNDARAWMGFRDPASHAETDPAGEFSLNYVVAGRYTLFVRHPDYSLFKQKKRFREGFDDSILVEMTAGGRIVGTVTDAAGVPQPDIAIMLLRSSPGEHQSADTDRDGNYVLPHLAPGSYSVAATLQEEGFGGSGGATEIKRATVRDGQDSRVDFIVGGAAVYGTITRAGQPVVGTYVIALPKGASWTAVSGSVGQAQSDQMGQYRIEGLRPGDYSLHLWGTVGQMPRRDFTIGDEDLLLDIALGGGQIAGSVYDELGRPIGGASLSLVPEAAEGDQVTGLFSYFWMDRGASESDEAGAFALEDVAPGTYRLYARADGYATHLVTVEKQADRDPPPIEIKLEQEGHIAGQVQVQGDSLPGRLLVLVCDDKGRLLTGDSTEVDPDTGEWKLSGTGPGRFTITAKAAGYAPVTKEITVSREQDTRVELQLHEGQDLLVTVRDSAGKPVPGAVVTLNADGDPLLGVALTYVAAYQEGDAEAGSGTDADGTKTLRHVGDGEQTVHVVADGYEPADVKARVAGNAQKVTVTLKPANVRAR